MTEAQVGFLEDLMEEQGYLEARQMAAAFQMLRPADLIWSRVIRHYLLGERTEPLNDLMAWNADATRMPARMHTTYLRKLFLENALANRTYRVDGRRVSLTDIRAPRLLPCHRNGSRLALAVCLQASGADRHGRAVSC